MYGFRAPQRLVPLILLLALSGCDGNKIVPVTGVLTYKGKPVNNAFIDFIPAEGRASWGQTDEAGRFKLSYDWDHDGATIGKHKVSVRPRPSAADQEAIMRGAKPTGSKDMAAFFEKYSSTNSKQEVVVDKSTKEVVLNWD